jgi:hypothetical protein
MKKILTAIVLAFVLLTGTILLTAPPGVAWAEGGD